MWESPSGGQRFIEVAYPSSLLVLSGQGLLALAEGRQDELFSFLMSRCAAVQSLLSVAPVRASSHAEWNVSACWVLFLLGLSAVVICMMGERHRWPQFLVYRVAIVAAALRGLWCGARALVLQPCCGASLPAPQCSSQGNYGSSQCLNFPRRDLGLVTASASLDSCED